MRLGNYVREVQQSFHALRERTALWGERHWPPGPSRDAESASPYPNPARYASSSRAIARPARFAPIVEALGP